MAIDLAEVTGAKAAQERKKEQPTIANGLDKNAFMKLFLEQLKNQDPTAPMETDKNHHPNRAAHASGNARRKQKNHARSRKCHEIQ